MIWLSADLESARIERRGRGEYVFNSFSYQKHSAKTMKLHLPLILLAVFTAAASAKSNTTVLTDDSVFTGAQNPGLITDQENVAVNYSGEGQHALSFVVDPEQPSANHFSLIQLESRQPYDLDLSFSDLKKLSFSGKGTDTSSTWVGAINVTGMGSSTLTIERISGDVSFDHFCGDRLGGGYDSNGPSLVFVDSLGTGTKAAIRIEGVGGKFSLTGNKAAKGEMMASSGLTARTSNDISSCTTSITLRRIRGGIDIIDNQRGGSTNASGLVFAYNEGAGSATIVLDNIGGGIQVRDNATHDYGMITAMAGSRNTAGEASVAITRVRGDVVFSGNSAYGSGALTLLSAKNNLEISGIEGNVLFEGNSSTAAAGAIYSGMTEEGERSRLVLSADGGDIVFHENTGASQTANAMLIEGETDLSLKAAKGRTIAFYDPVVIADQGETLSSVLMNEEGANGEILFSGELYQESGKTGNFTSSMEANVIQYGGTVRLAGKAVIATAGYAQQSGTLTMESGTALLSTGDIALNHLVVQLTPGRGPAVIESEGTFSLTGALDFTGALPEALESVLQITAKKTGKVPESATLTRDGVVYTVPLEWVQREQSWNVTLAGADIATTGVTSEQSGANVANAMLSSAANLQALGNETFEHIQAARSRQVGRGNVWIDGLGNFLTQRSERGIEGFDYQGGGYAMGGDYRLTRDWALGAAFGQMFGKNIARDYPSTNRQNTVAGTLGASWNRPVGKHSSVTISGSLGYGSTENEMTTNFSDGRASRGDWTSHSFLGVLNAAWNIQLPNNYTLIPELGLEYTDVLQQAFGETGDRARQFGQGHYRNLALPIGVSLQKRVEWSGHSWENGVSLSYVPDVCRREAETNARMSDYTWKARGSRPARNALRAGIFSRLALGPLWEVSCSYRIEARSKALDQTCRIGAAYTF